MRLTLRGNPTGVCLLGLGLLAGMSAAEAAPKIYNLTDLGGLGSNYAEALAINDNGTIVGAARDTNGNTLATLFDGAGGNFNQSLGTLLGGDSSRANDINNNGLIVGRSDNAAGQRRAVVFGNFVVDLGTFGGPESEAYAVNNSGVIVGEADTTDITNTLDNVPNAARFFANGSAPSNISPLSVTPTSSVAYGLSDNGTAVGDRPVNARAVRFTTSGIPVLTELGGIGNSFSQAFGANANGDIVGETFPGGVIHATLFDSSGGGANIDLSGAAGEFGQFSSSARSINDVGEIVGTAVVSPGGAFDDIRAAYFDTVDDMVYDLNTLVDPNDPDFGTLRLIAARDINNKGQIVGWASVVGQNNFLTAFLLTPVVEAEEEMDMPEPATWLLLGAALVGFASWRRRI
ncbi:MAG: DUF3466 family protein [Alphaproteobacteria bacterium]